MTKAWRRHTSCGKNHYLDEAKRQGCVQKPTHRFVALTISRSRHVLRGDPRRTSNATPEDQTNRPIHVFLPSVPDSTTVKGTETDGRDALLVQGRGTRQHEHKTLLSKSPSKFAPFRPPHLNLDSTPSTSKSLGPSTRHGDSAYVWRKLLWVCGMKCCIRWFGRCSRLSSIDRCVSCRLLAAACIRNMKRLSFCPWRCLRSDLQQRLTIYKKCPESPICHEIARCERRHCTRSMKHPVKCS